MRGPLAPTDPRRRDEIAAAVAAYNDANPLTQLPRSAARLLAVMFPESDVCRRSVEAITAEGGFAERSVPRALRHLELAGLLSRQRGTPDTYRLHLPPRVQP